MSKFKMRLKLTGFELDIEGTREDIPLIAQNVGQQIAGLLAPAAEIAAGEELTRSPEAQAGAQQVIDVTPKRRKRRTPTSTGVETERAATVLNWKHDPSKWSSPTQSWSTLSKSLWLLYVAEQETKQSELIVRQIADTFNTHFKQAKIIRAPNVTRDLGTKKAGKEALVGENTTVSPSKWYLTETGKAAVVKLISEGKG